MSWEVDQAQSIVRRREGDLFWHTYPPNEHRNLMHQVGAEIGYAYCSDEDDVPAFVAAMARVVAFARQALAEAEAENTARKQQAELLS